MKILMVSTASDGTYTVEGGADSALLRPGEPVFTDSDPGVRCLKVALAVRISKLGLHIPARHASRHYDAFAAMALHVPVIADGVSPLFHDRAVSPGAWIDAPELAGKPLDFAAVRRPLPGRSSEDVAISKSIDYGELNVDAVVSWLSQTMTLKTGDIVVFADTQLCFGAPLPDTAIAATLAGIESLSVRIK